MSAHKQSTLAAMFATPQWTKIRARRRRCHRHLGFEPLERRALLAILVSDALSGTADTTVGGTVYEDLDANGIKSPGENGIQGWTVYLDLDNSGTLNTDAVGAAEPSVLTNVDGDYQIASLKPGVYRINEILQTGWKATAPISRDVTVTQGNNTIADFFNFGGGVIVGTVWNDLNANGSREVDPVSGDFTDPGLKDWTVFLDLNNNTQADPTEPSTLTDANGNYMFTDLPPNDYEVTEILPSGWNVSPTYDLRQTASVVALQQTTAEFANFSTVNGSLRGTIWNDANIDGIRNVDPGTGEFVEPGLGDWTVYLDLNLNQLQDPSDPVALTNAKGEYSFISLAEGDYDVIEVLPEGWNVSPTYDSRQTVAVFAGTESIALEFANFTVMNGSIRGTIWNDVNRSGSRDIDFTGAFTEPGLSNWSIYLDRNRNGLPDPGEPTAVSGISGDYTFPDLQVGDYEVRESLPTGWEVSLGFSDSVPVMVFSGTQSIAPDFANFYISSLMPGSVSGVVWNDLNGNGLREANPGTGEFTDPGLTGRTVFVDVNTNGTFDAGEPTTTSGVDGSYTMTGVVPGSVSVVLQAMPGWRPTAPLGMVHTFAMTNGDNVLGLDFGMAEINDAAIQGVVFADADKDGIRSPTERGLPNIVVYLDLDNNSSLDSGEPQTITSPDLFFTPVIDEAGAYSFTHLAKGSYTVRVIVPASLSSTPSAELAHNVTLAAGEVKSGVNSAAVFRPNEIHGVWFEDTDGNGQQNVGETGVASATVYIDLDRDGVMDASEPSTATLADGSYSFGDLTPGAYVVRAIPIPGYDRTFPTTVGGTLWPSGISNPAVGNVSSASIELSLASGETHRQTVSLTLPNSGALTNLVDVFLLFDDTGSFTNNSPIVRDAFPTIISTLQAALPGIDLGFGVGRLEEYGNFAWEYSLGRPFILNQPIVAASTAGYMTAIQAALNRETPGYGGDQPETDIEALYQVVTGVGFDGNNNGLVLDSGPAGMASTQINPGDSGDVPPFSSFVPDPGNAVMAPDGTIGGAGFRAGALPIILTATDTGFGYQPKGETTITGVGGSTLPVSALTETSRPTTPWNLGAGLQQTVTALNALGALVIGLGTNPESTLDPRQGLESLSKLTGAVNQSLTTIDNGTADPIAPGDPFYFQIASGFGASVANGVVNAIQNAVTNVAVNVTVQASDPRVKIINHSGVVNSVGAGQTAAFDIEFVGDGVPFRFDLQFVRAGTNVVLGSIPVVIGTPIPGDGYEFEDLEDGQISTTAHFGDHPSPVVNSVPSFTAGANQSVLEDAAAQTIVSWATNISPGPPSDTGQSVDFIVSNDNHSLFSVQPAITPEGTLTFALAAQTNGTATVMVQIHDNGGTANGGVDISGTQDFTIDVLPVNDPPVAHAQNLVATAGESLSVSLAATDVESAAANLTFTVETLPALGTLMSGGVPVLIGQAFVGPPALTYETTTVAPVGGTDGFTFTVTDRGDPDAAVGGDPPLTSAPANISVDINHAPTDIQLSRNGVFADLPGAWIAGVKIVDPDAGEAQMIALSDSRFEVLNGQLYLKTDQMIDRALETTIELQVTSTDARGASLLRSFTLDVVERPANWLNPHHWAMNPVDVDADGLPVPMDAILIINELNANGSHDLPLDVVGRALPPFLDVSPDDFVAPLDAVLVINFLNARPVSASSARVSGLSTMAVDAVFGQLQPTTPATSQGTPKRLELRLTTAPVINDAGRSWNCALLNSEDPILTEGFGDHSSVENCWNDSRWIDELTHLRLGMLK